MLCPSCHIEHKRSVLELNNKFVRKVGTHVYTIIMFRCPVCSQLHQYALEIVEQLEQRIAEQQKSHVSRD